LLGDDVRQAQAPTGHIGLGISACIQAAGHRRDRSSWRSGVSRLALVWTLPSGPRPRR